MGRREVVKLGRYCTNCGEPVDTRARYCGKCGKMHVRPVKKGVGDKQYCPTCGAVLDIKKPFCGKCGDTFWERETLLGQLSDFLSVFLLPIALLGLVVVTIAWFESERSQYEWIVLLLSVLLAGCFVVMRVKRRQDRREGE